MSSQLNLIPSVLDRLLDDDPRGSSIDFNDADFRNLIGFATKLKEAGDPLSRYIHDSFVEETRHDLDEYQGGTPVAESLETGILVGLNLLIRRVPLYDSARFKHVKLSKETQWVVEQSPPGVVSVPLNRTLLEEAYPDELWKRRMEGPTYTVTKLKEHVSRDLAALLNTRQEANPDDIAEYGEAAKSLLIYGLPDFTDLSLTDPRHRKFIQRSVERAIATFEPRLKSVQVTLQPLEKFDPVLRFRIDALLRVEPAPEQVSFDALLHMKNLEYSVQA